ncbi:unnamed protein product [Caenorhabditis brenneri]
MVLIYLPSIEKVVRVASAVCEMFANGERLNPTSTLNGNSQAFRNQNILLNVNYEVLTLVDWESIDLELLLTWLEYLAISNYLPEMVLPISITVGSFNLLKKLKNAVTPKINRVVSVQGATMDS